jgi:hypothetical protein
MRVPTRAVENSRAWAVSLSGSVRLAGQASGYRTRPDKRDRDWKAVLRCSGVSFHLIGLQLGDEPEMLDRAIEALEEVEPGETAFLPEYLAWTAQGSGRAFAKLIGLAQRQDINIVTTLNLGGDLLEDLPGHDRGRRYNALTIFTRHGVAHVPQAKLSPQAFEMNDELDGPGIAVSPYTRINRVQLDVDEELVDARFLICSDLFVFNRFSPAELACDLLVVLGNFAHGAEAVARKLLGHALKAGVAETAVLVNAYDEPSKPRRQPLAIRVEDVLDATGAVKPASKWAHPRAIRNGFFLYRSGARDFVAMAKMRGRQGRIAVPEWLWNTPATIAEYPVTVVL